MPAKGYRKPNAKPRSVAQRAYQGKPEQRKRRAERNRARAQAEKQGRVKKGDGKHVHHPNATKKSLGKKTVVTSAKKNLADGGRRSYSKKRK